MSSSHSTNPSRPVPDEIAPSTQRVAADDTNPIEEDWFQGNIYPRVSKVENADRVDASPPHVELEAELAKPDTRDIPPGDCAIYWMRMNDLRLHDNHALSLASSHAQTHGIPLVVLVVLTPSEYKAHDRSKARIDFVLRSLRHLRAELADTLHIPLLTLNLPVKAGRMGVPKRVLTWMKARGATHLWGNLSYEVDELRRDLKTITLANAEGDAGGVRARFVHDRLVVKPGGVKKKTGGEGVYTVFSPWYRVWSETVQQNPELMQAYEDPLRNKPEAMEQFKQDFDDMDVPDSIEGYEVEKEKKDTLKVVYPAGEEAAIEIFRRFLKTKARVAQLGPVDPLAPGAEEGKDSRLGQYADGRNIAGMDTTSRMSPYLASGIVSPRALLREIAKQGKLVFEKKGSSVGTWVAELAWRDFYNHIMVAYPRVSMGQPFNVKYRGVQWETDSKLFTAWKEGKTGYPIVDAAMRQMNAQSWMHNRCRMIAASFLTKDLLIDWRLGERYFMTQFIDGDLAPNNGGWQWVASTGTDPQPYFRIFNPLAQSEKADPTGDYIRHFVPELRSLKGKDVHDPYGRLAPAAFKKLGYPAPIVEHKKARERALGRYKNVGEKPDEENGEQASVATEEKQGPKGLESFGFEAKTGPVEVSKGRKRKAVVESDEDEDVDENGAKQRSRKSKKTDKGTLEAFGFGKK